MNFAQAYQHYQIPPNLQLHQLRVAGVGYLVAQHCHFQVDSVLVARACLVHDMGNILKFDLSPNTAQRYGLTNLDQLRQIQQQFRQKYGSDEVKATFKICQELGLTKELEILKQENQLYEIKTVTLRGSWPVKILLYADMRVSPDGIVSLKSRLTDFLKRYNLHKPSLLNEAYQLENLLQQHTSINITAINESQTKPLYSQFLNWKV